jgi:cell division septum initiation protein DivIVA
MDKLRNLEDKYFELSEENEQLRAQLAERDAELKELRECNSHNFDEGVRLLAAGNTMKEKLAQAQETIADFRSALKYYANDDNYDMWVQQDDKSDGSSSACSEIDRGKRAREALSNHPDSTEVK